MNYKAHAAGAILTTASVYYIEMKLGASMNIALLISGGIIGGLLPDIDEPESFIGKMVRPLSGWIKRTVWHRTFTHSLVFIIITTLIAGMFDKTFAVGVELGMLSHIILDICDGRGTGVAFLYPICKKRLCKTK